MKQKRKDGRRNPVVAASKRAPKTGAGAHSDKRHEKRGHVEACLHRERYRSLLREKSPARFRAPVWDGCRATEKFVCV